MKKVITNIYEYFRQCDAVLWLLTLTAVAYSFLLIASMQRSGEYSYLRTQIIAVSVGLAASVFISIADYRFLIRKWYIAAIVGIVLAGLVFVCLEFRLAEQMIQHGLIFRVDLQYSRLSL